MKLNQLTIKQAYNGLKNRDFTSVELTKACLQRIKEVDNKVKACLTICEKQALDQAAKADVMIIKGEQKFLTGIPYICKDIIVTKNIRTTAASKILDNYFPSFDATVIKKLNQVGAVLIAKSNLDEFAHGASTENSAYGPTHNPWDLERVPGGSSGGSAAAMAADESIFTIGSDTGGSIRHPSSYCGVIGLKPTYGRCSRYGLIAMTSSTDVIGPITKTVEDSAIVLKQIAGSDKFDSTTVERKILDYHKEIKKNINGLKIGIPKEFFPKELDKDVEERLQDAINQFEKLGVKITQISLPHTKYAVPVYYIITPSEISSNLSRFDGIRYGESEVKEQNSKANNLLDVYYQSRGKWLGAETKRRIMLGTYALSAGYYDAYYLQAQKVRTIISNELKQELKKVDAILTPATPHPAFKIGEKKDPLSMYLEDVFMSSASLAGLPAISFPVGFINGLPIGAQIIGKPFDEATILKLAHHYEQASNWRKTKPEL